MSLTSYPRNAGTATLMDLLRQRALEGPDEVAYTFLNTTGSSQTVSYSTLDTRARAIAGWLQQEAGSGDRALLLYDAGLEFIEGFFGCVYAGTVAVPLPLPKPKVGLDRIRLVLEDTHARVALTSASLLPGFERGMAEASPAVSVRWRATDRVESLLAEDWEDPGITARTLAYLQYTSGSTDMPRGVMLQHRHVLHNLANIDDGFEHTRESVAVSWLPHFHDMGLIYGIFAPLFTGFRCYLMSPAAFVQRPHRWLEAISKYRATHSGGPNFAYDLCARMISQEQRAELDLSSWAVAFNGAEPVQSATLERFAASFEPSGFRRTAFYPAYGLAEAALKVTGSTRGSGAVVYPVSASALAQNRVVGAVPGGKDTRILVGCGKAGRDTRVAIVSPETLLPCAPGEVGEVWVAGPGVAEGYWNRPEETERTFRAHLGDSGEAPFLRTGDLGFLVNGELFVAGRLKDLIIIRGQNHHPRDIELTVEQAHPALRVGAGAAFTVQDDGEERLVVVQEVERGREFSAKEVAQAIRQAVAEQHEVQVWAIMLVKRGSVPKTSSGKTQRQLCRARFLAGELEVLGSSVLAGAEPAASVPLLTREFLRDASHEARRRLLEGYLAAHLAKVLHIDAARIESGIPVTAYGLDSLAAMELKNRVESDLGVTVSAGELLKGASVSDLAALISEGVTSEIAAADLAAVQRTGELPLSFEQERLWLLDQLSPGNASFHIPFAVRLKGNLDFGALERSAGEIVRRHEALRTTFTVADNKPVQVILPATPVTIPVADLSGLDPAGREREAARLAASDAQAPFSLSRGPLFRLKLIRLTNDDQVLVLTLHHIISDVWSVALFISELAALYRGEQKEETAAPPELPLQYADFAVWQRQRLQGATLERLVSYWRSRLAGAPLLDMPSDHPRSTAPTFRGATESFSFPAGLSPGLAARRQNVTLFVFLLAVFETLLARVTRQTDIVIGSTSANRTHGELEKLIGFFASPLVLRADLSGDPTFQDVVSRVREVVLQAYANQDLPFAKVVEAARPGRHSVYTALFPVMFSLIKSPLAGIEIPGLSLAPFEPETGATDFEIVFNIIEEAGALHASVTWNTDLYDRETIHSIADSYFRILTRAIESPETPLSDLPLAPAIETRTAEAAARDARRTIAIASTFTAEPVGESLSFWLKETGFDYRVRFAPYNQVFQQLLDPISLVSTNHSGINALLIRFEDWQRFDNGDNKRARVEENVRNFISVLKSASARSSSPFVVLICPPSPAFAAEPGGMEFCERLEHLLASELSGLGSVYLVRTGDFADLYPVADYYDAHADRLGHIPYTPLFFVSLGTILARRIHALRKVPYKVIVLDCDQTLWQGVCGEDGPHGVQIDEPHRQLQEFMVAQSRSGMLLSLCSKNNEEDVLDVFRQRPEMPLKLEHLVAWRLNWGAKSENLHALAEELQLGLESFIFVDDNPTECADVEANCPETLTLQLPPDPEDYPHFLRHVWAFDHLRITDEDRRRTALYTERLERGRLQKQAVSLEQFLAGLKLEINIAPMAPSQLPRVSQLTQRTNQMNATTIRRSEAEIQDLLRDGSVECLTVDVKDRFGSYGLVGVIFFASRSDGLVVDTFLLSCRALGRGVEHRMVARLGEIALERRRSTVEIPFTPSGKNRPALEFLQNIAPEHRRETISGAAFRLPATLGAAVTYKPQKPAPPADEGSTPKLLPATHEEGKATDFARIAQELSTPQHILDEIRLPAREVLLARKPYAAPRTPLERELAAIWAELLGVPAVGIHDNFFDLGGHSLLAVQLLSRVRETFQVDLSLNVVFAGEFTVAELAKAIEIQEIEQAGADEYAAILADIEGLSDEEVRALIAQEENSPSNRDSK